MASSSSRRPLPNGGLNPQAIFPIGSLTSLLVETDDDLNAALRDAIALARRLTFSPRGRFVSNISLQQPATPTVPIDDLPPPLRLDEGTQSQPIDSGIRDWFASQSMTIVLDTVMSADGKVRPGQPRVIRLQYDLVRAAGEAKKRCPTLIGAYEAHVLHLAIVIAHEIQHCLRLTMDGVPDDSPPKVLSHLHFGRRRFQGGVEFTSSESGWCWEQTMLGGIITRCEVGRGRPGFAYEHQIYELIVREGRRWFKMDEAIIETVVNGYSGWETLLPLSPSEDYPLMRTPHPDARHRDDQDEPEVHDSTQEPHESKTPPHQVIATDVVPRACGYLGPSDEADVDASREIEADMTSMRFQATRC